MLAAPLMSSLALLWVAIEVTTVISALLVAIEDTDGAAEAAWKYVLIASAGLGLALLATIFAYYAGAQVLGQSYDLAFSPLLHARRRLPHTPVRLAFVLAVLGYGTKMGLFPVHTWLPDAHSEAPTPVSALLSGSLLAVSFYAILRYYQVAAAALGPRFPRDVLLAFGVASLLLAALYLFDQRDIKRLLAYSSVEHMGILADRGELRRADRAGRRAAACAGARGGQGQRVHGRGRAGPQVRHASRSRRSAAAWTCCRGAGRCSCWPCSRCRRCRRSGSSAASSRSWPGGFASASDVAGGDPVCSSPWPFLGPAAVDHHRACCSARGRRSARRRRRATGARRAERLDGGPGRRPASRCCSSSACIRPPS